MFWHPMFYPMLFMAIVLGSCTTMQQQPQTPPPVEPAPSKIIKTPRAAPKTAPAKQAAPTQPEPPQPEHKPGAFLQRFHDTFEALRPHKREEGQ